MERVVIVTAERAAEEALQARLENLRCLRAAPCVILSEYAKVIQEIKEIENYLREKRKKLIFG